MFDQKDHVLSLDVHVRDLFIDAFVVGEDTVYGRDSVIYLGVNVAPQSGVVAFVEP